MLIANHIKKRCILLNTEKFSNKALQYAKGRPSYPASAVAYMKSLVPKGAVFADVGAGTGKLTGLLAQDGDRVFGVEPNPDMYAQLEITVGKHSNAVAVLATSENTTLDDRSVDLITVAQALHWFDLEAFRQECLRILKPRGWVVALYNHASAEGKGRTVHRTDATVNFFQNPIIKDFPNVTVYNLEEWLAYQTSHSHNPLPGEAGYDEHVAKAIQYFEENSTGGLLSYEIVTTVYAQQLG